MTRRAGRETRNRTRASTTSRTSFRDTRDSLGVNSGEFTAPASSMSRGGETGSSREVAGRDIGDTSEQRRQNDEAALALRQRWMVGPPPGGWIIRSKSREEEVDDTVHSRLGGD